MTADRPKYLFTVFIPTFNRAYVLPRTLASIEAQTLRDFEVLIVDDGSTDGTWELVREWAERVPFEVRYHYQPNGGKHVAHNTMLGLARGEFVVLLDSDDVLLPAALERFKYHWEQIPPSQRACFAGVEGLVERMDGQGICGRRFPQAVLDSEHIDVRIRQRVKGEKRNAIRAEVLRRFPYPVFPGERHIRPSLLWDRLAEAGYRFRFFNEAVQALEHQPDGLSANRFPLRMANPRGLRLCMLEEIRLHGPLLSLRQRWRLGVKYVRYSLHAGYGYPRQYRDIGAKGLWLGSLLPGTVSWLADRVRMKLRAAA
jgi:glycosyltransferase involved in cell wall biosynthesis